MVELMTSANYVNDFRCIKLSYKLEEKKCARNYGWSGLFIVSSFWMHISWALRSSKPLYFPPVRMHVSIWFALKTYYALHFLLLLYSYQEWVFRERKKNTHTQNLEITSKPCQSLFLVKFSPLIFQTTGISYDQPDFLAHFSCFSQWDNFTREKQKKNTEKDFFASLRHIQKQQQKNQQ